MAPKAEENRPYHHGNLKDALVKAGREILEKEGLEKLSLRGVARRAGVSQTAPYHHFEDKSALLAEIAGTGFRDLADAARLAIKEGKTPQEKLDRYGIGYVEFATRHPALFELMFSGQMREGKDYTELLAGASISFELLQQCVEGVFDGGGTSEEGIRIRTLSSWSLVHGLATLIIDGRVDPKNHGCKNAKELAAKMLKC